MEFLLALLAWLFFCELLKEILPPLIEAFAAAIEFLLTVLWKALMVILRGTWWLMVTCFQLMGRAAWWLIVACFRLMARAIELAALGVAVTFTFLLYLADEWIRGERIDDTVEDDTIDDEPDEEELYQAALQLFGLAEGFTRAALDAAFKRAMKEAHPDVGGSVDDAQAVNAARELLMRRKSAA